MSCPGEDEAEDPDAGGGLASRAWGCLAPHHRTLVGRLEYWSGVHVTDSETGNPRRLGWFLGPPGRSVCSCASPLIAGRDVGSSGQLGDAPAEVPEDISMEYQQSPILTLHAGGSGTSASGEEVMAALAEVLVTLLPTVPVDDPYRVALGAVASALGCRRQALAPRLEAL